MSPSSPQGNAQPLMRSSQQRLLMGVWVTLIIAGYLALHLLLQKEEQRDAASWDVRLGVMAGAQSRDVAHWQQQREKTLQELAENTSLRLYMTELNMPPQQPSLEAPVAEPAQQTFLRNLITTTARQGGFRLPENTASAGVRANLPPEQGAGLALFAHDGKLIAATASMPELGSLPASLQKRDTLKQKVMSVPFLNARQQPAVGFRMPIYGVQDDPASASPLGFVVGVSLLDDSLFDLLRSEDPAKQKEHALLLAKDETLGRVLFINDLLKDSKPLTLALEANAAHVEIQAVQHVAGMIRAHDHRGVDAMAVAAQVGQTPWYVVHSIDYADAMSETHLRAMWLNIAYVLTVMLITAAIVAVWRNATTLQARSMAEHFRKLAFRLERQEKLLDLIAQTTPISTFITDEHGYYRYANAMAATRADMQREDMLGKTLEAVLGKQRALPLIKGNTQALQEHTVLHQQHLVRAENGEVIEAMELVHIPLPAIPLVDSEENIPGLLVLEKDFTQAAQASEKRTRTLDQLVSTLVTMVDRRDPNAANHSALVAKLSEAIAIDMGLTPEEVATVRIAGKLMNIGKLQVPEAILTGKNSKKEDPREQIRVAMAASADLLEGIEFDGPVVTTLRQAMEHVDGSGSPLGLTGDAILLSAKIICLANAFIAIISPRAWREGRSVEEAIHITLEGVEKQFDRKVVVALINYLDNHGGRDALARWMIIK
jgi:HD-GYP domain-containing protein (c-di-GMP phosphodiesterase class II)